MKDELQTLYRNRFAGNEDYRRSVWRLLIADFFGTYLESARRVLDVGCGYGEFINQVNSPERYAIDLNPDARSRLETGVRLFEQDCSAHWPLEDQSLDLVFSSNFFEHLPDKPSLARTLGEAWRCLKPRGRLLAMGPNIKFLPGAYWDFWDHHLPLSELSLAEGLRSVGFEIERVVDRFLPFSMSRGRRYPLAVLRLYLRLPLCWKLFGKQFLVVAVKTG